MKNFDTITIQEISKADMLMILQALEYTGERKEMTEFLELRDNIINELATLTDITEEELVEFFKS